MSRVYLGLGSNIDREQMLAAGLDAMSALFGELSLSSVYDSDSIGFVGEPFLNMVIGVSTELSVAELAAALRAIEQAHGRPANASRNSPRRLDIDILTYDDRVGEEAGVELPRGEILDNAFVLCPLAELAPQARHPVDGRSYAELWLAYQQPQQLRRVAFCWGGRAISASAD